MGRSGPHPALVPQAGGAVRGFALRAFVVVLFAIAMANLEAAVVVYLRQALSVSPSDITGLSRATASSGLVGIETGREGATLVMLAAVGWLAGRSWPERLAWTAVAFGAWDIAYYAWLWIFSGWPSTLDTWDLLFLIPAPWVGPVWAPVAVSTALVGFGLAVAGRIRAGGRVLVMRGQAAAGVLGGLLVVASFLADAGDVMQGGQPTPFAWPVFATGLVVASLGALDALRRGRS